MAKVKRIAIYSLLSSGHFNVCVTLAKVLLNNYGDKIEIYFITGKRFFNFNDFIY